MQLNSMPPANVSGSSPVVSSSTPPASVGDGMPSGSPASSRAAPRPATSSSGEAASAQNDSRNVRRAPAPAVPAPEGVTESSNARNGDGPSSAREAGRGREPQGAPEGRERGQRQREDDGGSRGPDDASPEQQSATNELRSRDREVRQHEQAHKVVGGQYAGAPTYDYERGPDGQLYATGGQVSIDTSPVPDDPQATINKMQVVRAAALAPAEPSPQDIQAAQEATSQMLAARAELQADQREDVTGGDDASGTTSESEPGEEEYDPRIALFRDVDGFSDAPGRAEASTRFEAIA